jgi:hypothetical protein
MLTYAASLMGGHIRLEAARAARAAHFRTPPALVDNRCHCSVLMKSTCNSDKRQTYPNGRPFSIHYEVIHEGEFLIKLLFGKGFVRVSPLSRIL